MRTILVILALAAAFVSAAPIAAAEPGPCGPNVQYCQPFEPCRNPQTLLAELVCDPEQFIPVAP